MLVWRREFVGQGSASYAWWKGFIAFSEKEGLKDMESCLAPGAMDVPYSCTVCQDSWGRLHGIVTVG